MLFLSVEPILPNDCLTYAQDLLSRVIFEHEASEKVK